MNEIRMPTADCIGHHTFLFAVCILVLPLYACGGSAAGGMPSRPPKQDETTRQCSDLQSMLDHGAYQDLAECLSKASSDSTFAIRQQWYLQTGNYEQALQANQNTQEQTDSGRLIQARAYLYSGRAQQALALLDNPSFETVVASFESLYWRAIALQKLGLSTESQAGWHELLRQYHDQQANIAGRPMAFVAVALWKLGSIEEANALFMKAVATEKNSPDALVLQAEFFIAKEELARALESLDAALQINPRHPDIHALLSKVIIRRTFDTKSADKTASNALAVNPNHVQALLCRAETQLLLGRHLEAAKWIARAEAIDPQSLHLRAVKAGLALLSDRDQEFQQLEAEAFRSSIGHSDFYRELTRFAEWDHRYEELVKLARRAAIVRPYDANIHAALGLGYLRLGKEKEGIDFLKRAWKMNPYNVRVYNLLNLFEGAIQTDYIKKSDKDFAFRLPKDKSEVFLAYLQPMAQQVFAELSTRYGFHPQTPIHIESFQDSEQFSVRTTGLPTLGLQGVCFGHVVATLSPQAGAGNWAQIVWHEMVHVFHLQMSNYRVPRWFTEGLAEYETERVRPEWRREHDHELWIALRTGKLPSLVDFNRMFFDSKDQEDLVVAYYASTKFAEFASEKYGADKLTAMLRLWGEGKSTKEVFETTFGISISKLDMRFKKFLAGKLVRYSGRFFPEILEHQWSQQNKRSLPTWEYARSNQWNKLESFLQSLRQNPTYRALATYWQARAALAQGDVERGEKGLLELSKRYDSYDIRLTLARIYGRMFDFGNVVHNLRMATKLDPWRVEAWQGVHELAGHAKDEQTSSQMAQSLANIQQHEKHWPLEVLRYAFQNKQWNRAAQFAERCTHIDPYDPEVHFLWAQALVHAGKRQQADMEMQMSASLIAKADSALVEQVRAFARAHSFKKALRMLPR